MTHDFRRLRSFSGLLLRLLPSTKNQGASRSLPVTKVELVDDFGPPAHVARHVFVNGSEVLVAKDGVIVDFGPEEATSVTLRLLPTEIVFRGPKS